MTDHSLVPKAAAHAGITFPKMCARLVEKSQARMKGNHRMARNAAAASPSVVADSTTATMTQDESGAQDQTND
jgi:hypothetical protein